MKGYLQINRRGTKGPELIDYEFLFSLDPEKRNSLFRRYIKQYQAGQLSLLCKCVHSGIQMTLEDKTQTTGSYNLKSFPNQKAFHVTGCPFHADFLSHSFSSFYEQCISEDDKGNLMLHLNGKDYRPTRVQENARSNSQNTGIVLQNRSTLRSFIEFLITQAWNDLIRYMYENEKHDYPDIERLFRQIHQYTARKISIAPNISLNDHFYSGVKTGQIYALTRKHNSKVYPFVLTVMEGGVEVERNVELKTRHPITNEIAKFTVSAGLYKEARRMIKIKDKPFPWIIGGFAKPSEFGRPPEFVSFEMFSISDVGLPVKSKNERALYNKLCKDKRFFIKPINPKEIAEWENVLPSCLLIDTAKPTVLEVFDPEAEGINRYRARKNSITQHFNKMKTCNLWCWDVQANKEIGEFPKSQISIHFKS